MPKLTAVVTSTRITIRTTHPPRGMGLAVHYALTPYGSVSRLVMTVGGVKHYKWLDDGVTDDFLESIGGSRNFLVEVNGSTVEGYWSVPIHDATLPCLEGIDRKWMSLPCSSLPEVFSQVRRHLPILVQGHRAFPQNSPDPFRVTLAEALLVSFLSPVHSPVQFAHTIQVMDSVVRSRKIESEIMSWASPDAITAGLACVAFLRYCEGKGDVLQTPAGSFIEAPADLKALVSVLNCLTNLHIYYRGELEKRAFLQRPDLLQFGNPRQPFLPKGLAHSPDADGFAALFHEALVNQSFYFLDGTEFSFSDEFISRIVIWFDEQSSIFAFVALGEGGACWAKICSTAEGIFGSTSTLENINFEMNDARHREFASAILIVVAACFRDAVVLEVVQRDGPRIRRPRLGLKDRREPPTVRYLARRSYHDPEPTKAQEGLVVARNELIQQSVVSARTTVRGCFTRQKPAANRQNQLNMAGITVPEGV